MSNIKLTGSSMGTFQACAKNYKLRYIEKLEAIDRPSYLTLGSAFHDAVQVLREGGSHGDMMMAALKAELDRDDKCVLTVMVEAYHHKYRKESGAFAKVEFEFSVPLDDDSELAGKVDALAVADDGHIIYETKTVGRIDGEYLKKLWSARQTLIYNWALNKAAWNIQGVIYDLVQKPGIKRLAATPEENRKYVVDKRTGKKRLYSRQRDKDESDAEFLARLRAWYEEHPESLHRELVIYSPAQLDAIQQDVLDEVLRLFWHTRNNVWPRSLNSCYRYRGACEFDPLCSSGGNPVILETHYRRREKTHSELGETNDNSDTDTKN